ncbi:MAG: hypothetical protein RL095_863 [Verrucomicrobiota bacterium]|jgi:LacI family transcriptional regulator
MSELKQIALAFPLGIRHLEKVTAGISRFARERGWRLITNPESHRLRFEELQGWQGDGIIAFLDTPREVDLALGFGLPLVNLSGALSRTPFPRVRNDYAAIGATAARHLLSRGFQEFAFYGLRGLWYADEIGRGYAETLAAASLTPRRFDAASPIHAPTSWIAETGALGEWLLSLPRPCALLCPQDQRGLLALQAALQAGLRVPQDLAIIGSNDDGIVCELANPSLSSVVRAGEELGYAAAKLLQDLMEGHPSPAGDLVFPPGKVMERESSAVYVLQDPDLRRALAWIQVNVAASITVSAVAAHIGRSRRWLEYAFQEELECTPLDFILKSRIEGVLRQRRRQPEAKLSSLAWENGFSSTAQMQRAFRKITGAPLK